MLTNSPGHSDTHKFPTQRPSPADLILWKMALCMISSNFLVLTVPLQEYVCYPHNLPQWMINNDGLILHNIISMGNREYHEVSIPTSKPLARKTWSGQWFNSTMVVMGRSGLQNFCKRHSITAGTRRGTFLNTTIHSPPSCLWIRSRN